MGSSKEINNIVVRIKDAYPQYWQAILDKAGLTEEEAIHLFLTHIITNAFEHIVPKNERRQMSRNMWEKMNGPTGLTVVEKVVIDGKTVWRDVGEEIIANMPEEND